MREFLGNNLIWVLKAQWIQKVGSGNVIASRKTNWKMQYKCIHSIPITQYTYYFIYTSTAGDVCFFFSNHLSGWLHAEEIFISIYIFFLCKFSVTLEHCRKMKVRLTRYLSFFCKETVVLILYLIWCCNILSCREQLLLRKMAYLSEVYS